jgi:hypothetical protein
MVRTAILLIALAVSGLAGAADAPERLTQLSYIEGSIRYQPDGQLETSTLPERPLARGDRLATLAGGHAELALGNATLRLAPESRLEVIELSARAARLELLAGTASVHLYDLYDGETVELVVPNTSIKLTEPGEYRVDVRSERTTELSVRTGGAEVETAGGPVHVAGGQRVRFEGSQSLASLLTPRPADAFDDWVLEREVALAESAPDEQSEYYADETLDDYGEWVDDPTYGSVWMPSYAYGGYDPFSYGVWMSSGSGWSWVNPMPWGPYTSYYGHWTYLPHYNRWGWAGQREFERRVARRSEQLERALREDRRVRSETHPVGRPAQSANDRRLVERANELDERLEAARETRVMRGSQQPSTNSSRGSSLAERQAEAASRLSTSRGGGSAAAAPRSARPAPAPAASAAPSRPAPSSTSSASRAARPSASQSTSKAFGKPQDP